MVTNVFEKQRQERAAKVAKYQEIKAARPEAVLFWMVGNMYEAVNEDADVLGEITGLHVAEFPDGVRLCGFPDYSLDVYLPKLLRSGKRVAICEDIIKQGGQQ